MQHVTDCHVDPLVERATAEERERAHVLYLALAGMGCPHCANRVRNALLRTRGVVDVVMDLPAGLATVWLRSGEAGTAELVDAVAWAGRGTHHRYLAVPVTPVEGGPS